MNISDLDQSEYQEIPLYTMEDNNHNEVPVFIRHMRSSDIISPRHRHEAIQINFITKGKLSHAINNSTYELVKGDIFIIPPYIPHQLFIIDDTPFELTELEFIPEFIFGNTSTPFSDPNYNTSVFDFSYVEPFLVSECNVKPRLNLTGEKQMTVEALLDEIYEEYTQRPDSFLLALKADLLKLLVLLGRYFQEETQDDSGHLYEHHRDAMMAAIRYVDEHFRDPITIEDTARKAMLSQSYFSYLFKAITHETFVEYVTRQRIHSAMELLKNSSELVVDICFEVGFNSVNHFNRTFKNVVGVSPLQYRKSNRAAPGRVSE